MLCDKDDNANIVHWHSSRATRRPHSTEQAELLALDTALQSAENLSKMAFNLLNRQIPVVFYIDCDILWTNLMNETVPTLPEVGYRCREAITYKRVDSMCLISGCYNPADGFTKLKPNGVLKSVVASNKLATPVKHVFTLQDCQFRHLSYIPTSSVPMPMDSA